MTTHANLSVTIAIGNAATQEVDDVAQLVRIAAEAIALTSFEAIDRRSIPLTDYNGNRVGSVQVTGYYAEPDEDDEPGNDFGAYEPDLEEEI